MVGHLPDYGLSSPLRCATRVEAQSWAVRLGVIRAPLLWGNPMAARKEDQRLWPGCLLSPPVAAHVDPGSPGDVENCYSPSVSDSLMRSAPSTTSRIKALLIEAAPNSVII